MTCLSCKSFSLDNYLTDELRFHIVFSTLLIAFELKKKNSSIIYENTMKSIYLKIKKTVNNIQSSPLSNENSDCGYCPLGLFLILRMINLNQKYY